MPFDENVYCCRFTHNQDITISLCWVNFTKLINWLLNFQIYPGGLPVLARLQTHVQIVLHMLIT